MLSQSLKVSAFAVPTAHSEFKLESHSVDTIITVYARITSEAVRICLLGQVNDQYGITLTYLQDISISARVQHIFMSYTYLQEFNITEVVQHINMSLLYL